jgi:hypothetical protein
MKKMNVLIVAVVVALTCSGCSGLEIGGKAWIMKVDEAQSSQQTNAQPPLKCLFVNCNERRVINAEDMK